MAPQDPSRISTRAYNVLMSNGFIVKAEGDLIEIDLKKLAKLSEAELLRLNNCGRRTLNEIKNLLFDNGLTLTGSHFEFPSAWPPDRDIWIFRMRELGYTFGEVGEVFAMTAEKTAEIYRSVKELMDESLLFTKYVVKKGLGQ